MTGLVISRRVGERVRIGPLDGEHIWIEVDRIEKSMVRLRIEAPGQIEIWREELVKDD